MDSKKPGLETGLPVEQAPEKDKPSRPEQVTTKRGLWMRANYMMSKGTLHGKKGVSHWREKRDALYQELLKEANL